MADSLNLFAFRQTLKTSQEFRGSLLPSNYCVCWGIATSHQHADGIPALAVSAILLLSPPDFLIKCPGAAPTGPTNEVLCTCLTSRWLTPNSAPCALPRPLMPPRVSAGADRRAQGSSGGRCRGRARSTGEHAQPLCRDDCPRWDASTAGSGWRVAQGGGSISDGGAGEGATACSTGCSAAVGGGTAPAGIQRKVQARGPEGQSCKVRLKCCRGWHRAVAGFGWDVQA